MFYSQIILAKKGPLGRIWQAAHWGDKKLGRPAIFATDVSAAIDSIAHPAAPMALRVSGHLLLGVVRIYSRQVKFLLDDCHQAMVKVKLAYNNNNSISADGATTTTANSNNAGGGTIDIAVTTTTTARGSSGGGRHANANHANAASMAGALNVSNFGEYTDGAADFYTTNFSIPLEEFLNLVDGSSNSTNNNNNEEEDWVPAELDESTLNLASNHLAYHYEEDTSGGGGGAAAALNNNNNAGSVGTGGSTLDSAVQAADRTLLLDNNTATTPTEQWGVFDPFDEEEQDTNHNNAADKNNSAEKEERDEGSTVSEIELTRAAINNNNESMASGNDNSRRRASVLQNESVSTTAAASASASVVRGNVSDTDFPMDNDNDDDMMMMMDDDDEDSAAGRRKSLRLSLSRDDDSSRGGGGGGDNSATAGISFGSDGGEFSTAAAAATAQTLATTQKKKRKSTDAAATTTTNKRRKRRRKVVTDDRSTELLNEHIRAMLADTSDTCRHGMVHPATWVPPDGGPAAAAAVALGSSSSSSSLVQKNADAELLFAHLTYVQHFCRPALGDDGHLGPALLALWARNSAHVVGKSFDYELVTTDDDDDENFDDKERNAAAAATEQEEAEDEDVEKARSGGAAADNNTAEDFPQANEDEGFPDADGGDIPFNDDADGGGGGIPFDDDEDDQRMMRQGDDDDEIPLADSPAGNSQRSIESIFSLGATNGLDDVDFGVDEDDRDETTTTSKWHKNTLKVFDVLKKNLAPTDGSAKKDIASYNELSEGVSRRTAAGFFFELLQLKTLNYIELNQDESYGDIKISAGVKFTEDPPTK